MIGYKVSLYVCLCLLWFPSFVFALTGQEIGSDVLDMWYNREYDQIETYVNSKFESNPNFIPVIVAKAFVDAIWDGDAESAIARLELVKNYLQDIEYKEKIVISALNFELYQMNFSVKQHALAGHSFDDLKQNASPSTIRGFCPDDMDILCNTLILRLIDQVPDLNVE